MDLLSHKAQNTLAPIDQIARNINQWLAGKTLEEMRGLMQEG